MTDTFRPLKDAFGQFATGIAIAACKNTSGGFTAITINSFTSVSLDPPLVLWCLERHASAFTDFAEASSYSVSILSADQQSYSERFAGFEPAPLAQSEYDASNTGTPLIKNRLAGFDCKIVSRYEAGDHVIMVGEVVQFDSIKGDPLVYFSSNYIAGINNAASE